MTFNHFGITSFSSVNLDFDITSKVSVIWGNFSTLALDLMREIIGDSFHQASLDAYDDGRFVMWADMSIDGKEYGVSYIRNADTMGDNRIAVNFEPDSIEFSLDDTREYISKTNEYNLDFDNVFFKSRAKAGEKALSESCRVIEGFELWVESCLVNSTDKRPIFIYDLLDYIDDACDVGKIFDMLSAFGRQVFIAVGKNYPINKLVGTSACAVYSDGEGV